MSDKDNPDEPVGVDAQQALGAQTEPVSKEEKEQQRAVGDFDKVNSDKLKMKVQVYSPFRDYYDGLAFSLTAESATGPFDILPKHHNFISLLLPCDLIIRTISEGERRIQISGGIMHVKADQVIVFLDV